MKLQFDPNQQYQLDAINAADLFVGKESAKSEKGVKCGKRFYGRKENLKNRTGWTIWTAWTKWTRRSFASTRLGIDGDDYFP